MKISLNLNQYRNGIANNNVLLTKSNAINKSNENIKNNLSTNSILFQHPSFLGGYSLNLDETFKNLEQDEYPNQEIYSKITEILDDGNPQNKTLCDVHFEKYKGVLDCYTLDDLKEKYPEFKDVNSAWDVEAREKSFIAEFQEGKSKVFSSGEDLTLQLIKLYWGQGFSLTDLSKHIAQFEGNDKGLNLYYAMTNKLNIPLMNPKYASVLKLSNKEYNKEISEMMSIKIKEAYEAKMQMQDGEAVIIPRGPLSDAHKKHISQGLKKHYLEHPEKLYKMSERQLDFYKNNPEKKEELSQVMLYAWNSTIEGKKLCKHISRFMKKYNNTTVDEKQLSFMSELKKEQKTALDAFWKMSPWAQSELSSAMKKGYEYLAYEVSSIIDCKTIKNKCIVYNTIPTKLADKIRAWSVQNGYNESDLLTKFTIYKDLAEQNRLDNKRARNLIAKSNGVMDAYEAKHKGMQDDCAQYYIIAIISTLDKFLSKSPDLPTRALEIESVRKSMAKVMNDMCLKHGLYTIDNLGRRRFTENCVNNETLTAIVQAIMRVSMILEMWDFGEFYNSELERAYNID